MGELIVYHTLSDLYRALNLPIEQEVDFTIHFLPDIHSELPFKSPKFRTEYYSFVFVKDGRGTYTTDEHVFPTVPATIYFTSPGHIKAFEMQALHEAYIITLTEAFLKEQVHADIFEEFPFLLAETAPPATLPGNAAYASMKGAIEVFTRYLAKELGRRGITANTVAPGAIETDFTAPAFATNPQIKEDIAQQTALGRVGLPDDIGSIVAFLCTENARWINAQRLEASGGMFL
ncbi:hypothetical protein OKW21_003798 [Catalinimonas alkaloidigena]|uniref:SDR family oxidoreductase n=1 Tax=Catalinimonas alkaloidigena TaxID=1075417 RepID=UPI002404A4AB|nr:SDR family oxidoreductase [Catalinimonas alkaloidigena]MDF9798535.1 hypothetical protein [Catalinimonas alkaloidigena]